jgi:hypothetical protein
MASRSRRSLLGAVLLVGVALVLTVPSPLGGRADPHALPQRPGAARPATEVVGNLGRSGPVGPALSGASARMIVSTDDPNAVPDDGLATNLTAFPSVSFPKNSSFQTGAEQVIGGFDAVFGLFTNDQTPPVAFFEVFNNSTDASVRLEYWVSLPIVQGDPYDFQLLSVGGGTWSLSVNGVAFGNNTTTAEFDFRASQATWEGGIGYSEVAIYSATTTVPSSYLATSALAVHRPGSGWYLPTEGAAHFIGPPGDAWGADGRIEIPDLPPGAVESGTSLGAVDANSSLWTGGPVPVNVTVSVSESNVSGLGAAPVTVTVASLSGESLEGVPVYIGDSLDGNASPSTVLTSNEGAASTLLLAPNVSAVAMDTIRATVTILGYVGTSTTGLAIDPALEVVLTASPSSLALAPNENTSVLFQTDTAGHQPVGEITLTFEGLAFNGVLGVPLFLVTYPDAGVTNATGALEVFVQAPSGSGSFAVFARVTSLGDWGHANVSVSVRSVPPSFWSRYGRDVEVGAGVGALVVVAGLVVVLLGRRRRGRSALPEMDLRSLRQRPGSEGEKIAPPVSRTPPASGTP